jgi:hypothetical protein
MVVSLRWVLYWRQTGRLIVDRNKTLIFIQQTASGKATLTLIQEFSSVNSSVSQLVVTTELRRQFNSSVFSCEVLTSGQRKLRSDRYLNQTQVIHSEKEETINCNESGNKSNHPIQNPLLLLTEPRTSDNTVGRNVIFSRLICKMCYMLCFSCCPSSC